MNSCMAQLPAARQACDAAGIKAPACLLVVLDEELAGLELVWIHDVEQLPPRGIIFLQILSVEFLRTMLIQAMPILAARVSGTYSINTAKGITHALKPSCNE